MFTTAKNVVLAAPVDLSKGFGDFFGSIGLTGTGLVMKGVAAVIAIVALRMLIQIPGNPKHALRNGSVGLGVLFVAVVLAMYGPDLFSTVTKAQ
ncbi:hypothetical protein [Streptomyces sp. NPDC046821]|uniref:hypothetical protein n=1 Tax=Streptomyces sp. NPDC046821 TaxID=3154702 RepID=UPI003402E395